MIFNPTHWTAWQGRLPAMIDAIDAIDAGLAEAEQDGLPPVGLCVSLLRTLSASAAAELVDALIALRHPRVVAFSTDGNEAANPAAPRACATPSNCWARNSINASFADADADVKARLVEELARW